MSGNEDFIKNPVKPINWNNIEDDKDLEIWNKLTSNFWLPEAIPLSNDKKSWETLNDKEQLATMRVLSNLTLLDTIQGSVGAVSLIPDALTQHEEAVYANIAFMEAFAAGTQLLTTNGWKNIEDVESIDKVAQFDPDSNNVSFVNPKIVPPHFSEEVYEISSQGKGAKQVVSGGHRVYMEHKNVDSGQWELVVFEARDITNEILADENYRLRIAAPTKAGEGLTYEEELLIAIGTHGKIPRKRHAEKENGFVTVKVRLTNPVQAKKLAKIAMHCQWILLENTSSSDNRKRLEIDVPLSVIKGEKEKDAAAERFDTSFSHLWNLEGKSSTWAREFIDALCFWNGHNDDNGEQIVCVKNKKGADFVQAASVLAGFKSSVLSNEEDFNLGDEQIVIQVSREEDSESTTAYEIKRVDNQKVYCVQVPTSYLVTKNGQTPVISGNCVHAKSYSNIFMTLASTPQIDAAFKWTQENEQVQKKAQIISRYYKEDNPLKKKIASTLLESFLFYSGFYLPLNWAVHSKLTNTADIIRLIVRDEALHGYYIGYKYQQGIERLTEREKSYYQEHTYKLLEELYENEVKYTSDIYDSLGWTEDVNKFLKYNANKALHNLGYKELFTGEDARPSAAILTSLSPNSDENHDFFSGSGATYVIGKTEETTEDDWDF